MILYVLILLTRYFVSMFLNHKKSLKARIALHHWPNLFTNSLLSFMLGTFHIFTLDVYQLRFRIICFINHSSSNLYPVFHFIEARLSSSGEICNFIEYGDHRGINKSNDQSLFFLIDVFINVSK